MEPFEYNVSASRVVFGNGSIKKLPDEISNLGLSAPLLLSTSQQVSQAEDVKGILGGKISGIFSEATMHTPTDVTEKALQYAKAQGADSVVSIGGGSTIGLGKAISIRTGLYHISIPTTYAGSEMTPILGETAEGLKKTRSDPKILPGTVIYDVDLTMSLPVAMSATSGINAIAHAGKSNQLSLSPMKYFCSSSRSKLQSKRCMPATVTPSSVFLHRKGYVHSPHRYRKSSEIPPQPQLDLEPSMAPGSAEHASVVSGCPSTTNSATRSGEVSTSLTQKRTQPSFPMPSHTMPRISPRP